MIFAKKAVFAKKIWARWLWKIAFFCVIFDTRLTSQLFFLPHATLSKIGGYFYWFPRHLSLSEIEGNFLRLRSPCKLNFGQKSGGKFRKIFWKMQPSAEWLIFGPNPPPDAEGIAGALNSKFWGKFWRFWYGKHRRKKLTRQWGIKLFFEPYSWFAKNGQQPNFCIRVTENFVEKNFGKTREVYLRVNILYIIYIIIQMDFNWVSFFDVNSTLFFSHFLISN